MRLDLFLVQKQLAQSRTQSQDFIEKGFVYFFNGKEKIQIKKASYHVDDSNSEFIFVEHNVLQKYVSRAGLKLESALLNLKQNVDGFKVLDIGQSTGGFTDCLIQNGASMVVGVDVGHGQIHPKIKNNEKIVCIEGLNAKDLRFDQNFAARIPSELFDMIVMDVSFISITKVIPYLPEFLKKNGYYLFLVKPQFECGPALLDKNGIVKETSFYKTIENNVREVVTKCFGGVESYIESELPGKDGNLEFFIYGQKSI